jgi:hypothetical protein
LITCRSGNQGTAFEILLPVRRHPGPLAPGRESV